ncbi:hypothetical protein DSM106972_019880 [Dulcicalothrix desertica PCC 7102]|uniref:Chaperone protein CcmS domain-containing protein n=1 Tax=Dulcicalothrix desertica PCC 7102 TaxID=232991 RepID=A0A433VNM0_9CYAN|nr:hypothetical protein [Dulcicalothrix desertica]RUT07728.1 hypothetical protein DSM106972_019880 [Dulcicalothrix desertica PCC 7102]TWH39263.1 hypothetical protein CAL7102_08481 [Dulcicalothrix desertica PCC 7102]
MFTTSSQPSSPENEWRHRLDKFVKDHKIELAALSWGLWLENGNSQGTIGIDLQPTPHFVYCPPTAVESLNDRVENRLQEILGLIKHHKPEVEVLMIGIGKDQVKLIYFEPETAPPQSFEQLGKDVDTLIEELETKLGACLS